MESGVLDKGDIQKVQGRGSSRTGLGSTELEQYPATNKINCTSFIVSVKVDKAA